jgi:hypothetical protein
MRVSQEPDRLRERAIRAVAAGLLLGIALCVGGAALIIELSVGQLAPPGFVAGRTRLQTRELAGVELTLLATESARGERGEPASNPVSMPAPSASRGGTSFAQATDDYLRGARPLRQRRDPRVDYRDIEPGAAR